MSNRFVGIGLEKEQPKSEKHPKFTKGEYLLEVIENRIISAKDGDALLRVFKIKENVGPESLLAGTEAAAKLLYIGQKWVAARISEYVWSLTGTKVTGPQLLEVANKIFGEGNPAKGKLVRLRVSDAQNDDGKPYLRNDWRYVAEDDAKPEPKAKK